MLTGRQRLPGMRNTSSGDNLKGRLWAQIPHLLSCQNSFSFLTLNHRSSAGRKEEEIELSCEKVMTEWLSNRQTLKLEGMGFTLSWKNQLFWCQQH